MLVRQVRNELSELGCITSAGAAPSSPCGGRRWSDRAARSIQPLEDVRQQLELVLGALAK